MEKTNIDNKSTEIVSALEAHFKGKINRSRIKFIAMFVAALCKVQTVGFEKLANAFDTPAKSASSLRRIQRFVATYVFDRDIVARLIFALLPERENLKLSIDRTNWKFGKANINIFMLGVCYKGLAFPLMFSMLHKRGNSNTHERIELVQRFIRLFGSDCIDSLLADREFVGEKWLGYLNSQGIRYHIRIKNNFKAFLPRKQAQVKVSWLFNSLSLGQSRHYEHIVMLGTQLCYISGTKVPGRDNKQEFVIIVSYSRPEQALVEYSYRWQIETCFRAIKSSGFDMEKTHLRQTDRVGKLCLLVMIAFVWCYKTGMFIDRHVEKIKTKKHGRKAKSIFKCGLHHISNVLLNANNQDVLGIVNFLSCT